MSVHSEILVGVCYALEFCFLSTVLYSSIVTGHHLLCVAPTVSEQNKETVSFYKLQSFFSFCVFVTLKCFFLFRVPR